MSDETFAVLPGIACLGLAAAAAVAARGDAAHARLAARIAGMTAFCAAVASLAVLAVAGPIVTPALGAAGFGLSFRLDALSAVVFAVVAFVGMVVLEYSRNYLRGQPRQATFFGFLCLTIAAAIALATAGNLLQLLVAWVATSLTLHRLLVFFPERPRAVLAARKKFWIARIGDVCLALAAVALWQAFASADIGDILAQARAAVAADAVPVQAHVACILIATAALLKSAQFPTHGWLTEVMETPTPVSALLHAGIVNAGGFLVIRFADVMVASPGAMLVLVAVGGFTALFGSVVMLTQTSVKVALGFSTVAQMGFMLLQCGLGAFSSAALHLVAHSLYKAHGFLASGTAVDAVRASRAARGAQSPGTPMPVLSLTAALAIYTGVGLLFAEAGHSLAVFLLGAVFTMGLFVLLAKAMDGRQVLVRVLPLAAVAATLYFTLQTAAARMFATLTPAAPQPGPVAVTLAALLLACFAAVTVLQVRHTPRASRWARAAYVHLSNGLYANALFNRLAGARRHAAATRT